MGSAQDFIHRHPDVRIVQKSEAWRVLKEHYALHDDEPGLYVVRGDTVGDEDELLVDALARGSAPQTPDPLARRLFEELPATLQDSVLKELRNIKQKGG